MSLECDHGERGTRSSITTGSWLETAAAGNYSITTNRLVPKSGLIILLTSSLNTQEASRAGKPFIILLTV